MAREFQQEISSKSLIVSWQQDPFPKIKQLLPYVIMGLCLLIGLINLGFNGFIRNYGKEGVDFPQYYVAGTLWSQGQNAYDLAVFQETNRKLGLGDLNIDFGLLYPPQLYWIAVPLSWTAPQTAQQIFGIISLMLWIFSTGMLGLLIYREGHFNAYALAILFLLMGNFGVVNSFISSQITPFIFTSLILAYFLMQRGHFVASGFILAFAALKPQTIFLLVPIILFQRNYRMLIGVLIGGLVFNVTPILLMGQSVLDVFVSWVTRLESVDNGLNIPYPAETISSNMIHLQVITNRVLNQHSSFSILINTLVIGILVIAAIYPIVRAGSTGKTRLLDFALGCAIPLTMFYNRWYGLFALAPAVMVIYVHIRSLESASARRWWIGWLVIILVILSIPNRTLWDPMAELLDQHPEMWLVQVLLPYQAWLCLGISISLIYLRWRAWFNSSSRQPVRVETAAA